MYRKGVAALLINKNKEFLLVNLFSFKEEYYAVPGGGSNYEESLEDTVYREIEEELGITKNNLKMIGVSKIPLRIKFKEIKLNREGIEYEGSEKYYFGFEYIGNENKITLPQNEVRNYKWIPFNKLNKYLLFDSQLEDTKKKIKEIFKGFV